MDDIFIIKPPSAPTIQQKKYNVTNWKDWAEVSRTGQPQTSPIEWRIYWQQASFLSTISR